MSRLAAASSAATTRVVSPIFEDEVAALPGLAGAWARASAFTGAKGAVLLVPGEDGEAASAFLGLGGRKETIAERSLLAGALAPALPAGDWRLAEGDALDPELASLAFLLGGYSFGRYRKKPAKMAEGRLEASAGVDADRVRDLAAGVFLARDLINIPANDMGPDAIEAAVRELAREFGADVSSIVGEELLETNFPMIHAVGRAGAVAPRLVDLSWGRVDAPKVTLVGKGVSFDTGGLDIKPASAMLLMKKDMGGAANVLGLARMVMARRLDVRLRVLVPAVENAIAGNAFRPGDVLKSRHGKTVEIGNTDAEGRLVLADALSLADEETPELLVDMATLTGAARVALGPDVPPFYTDDEALAAEIAAASKAVADPVWRMPLHAPYAANLSSRIADINNVTTDGFAGSITAALFLQGFVEKARAYAHFDIYGWRPKSSPIGPIGGEAQGIRALFSVLAARHPAK